MNLHSHSISSLQGVLTVPGDKSISHRAAILGGLAEGVTEVDNFLCSEDCLNTLRAMEQLGAKVDVLEERQGYGPVRFRITGVAMSPKAPERPIDCGNSGTGMRLLAGMLANGSFHLGDWQTWLVFGSYVLCVLFEQFNMVHSYMMRSIAVDPSEVTQTLSVGLSVDHVMAIIASPIMGLIWSAWGVQYVFYLAALPVLFQLAAAAMMEEKQ